MSLITKLATTNTGRICINFASQQFARRSGPNLGFHANAKGEPVFSRPVSLSELEIDQALSNPIRRDVAMLSLEKLDLFPAPADSQAGQRRTTGFEHHQAVRSAGKVHCEAEIWHTLRTAGRMPVLPPRVGVVFGGKVYLHKGARICLCYYPDAPWSRSDNPWHYVHLGNEWMSSCFFACVEPQAFEVLRPEGPPDRGWTGDMLPVFA